MNRRGSGVVFCFIAAFLYATRYICAAIFGSNVSSWDSGLYSNMLDYVGNGLTTFAVISLIIGIIYLSAAEYKGKNSNKDEEVETDEMDNNESNQ